MKDHFQQFLEATGAARALPQILVHRDSDAIAAVNEASVAFYGWPRATMQAMRMSDLDASGSAASHALGHDARDVRRSLRARCTHRVAGGATRQVDMCTAGVVVESNSLVHVIVLELPPVANGERTPRRIVHDFNNLLTVLRGSAVFLRDAIEPSSQAGEDLAAIERATDRAEALLNELLAVIPRG